MGMILDKSPRFLIWMLISMGSVTAFTILIKMFLAFNISASLPEWGWVRWPFIPAEASTYRLGDKVEFKPSIETGLIRSVKIIAGLPGEEITVDASRNVFVGGRLIGKAKTATSWGKTLQVITAEVIPPDHFFMAGVHPASFDSRYASFGLIPVSAISARVYALPSLPGIDGPLLDATAWQKRIAQSHGDKP